MFHLGALAILSYTFLLSSDETYPFNQIFLNYGGRVNFLTLWGLVLSIVAFITHVLVDLFPNFPYLIDLKKILNVAAFSIESLVTTLYWPLVLFSPALMASPELNLELPPIARDLAFHLYPLLLLWIDYLFFDDRFTNINRTVIRLSNGTQIKSSVLILLVTVAYVARIEFTHFKNNVPLPYPFLQLVSLSSRALIYFGAASLSYFHLLMSEKLYNSIVLNCQKTR